MSTATNTIANAGETSSQKDSARARPNPIAAEVPVNASGTRPKSGGTERELFSEDTETVLTFEDGAVIRLLATVTPGQLIFLTNLVTRQEVVCEVLRKRLLRPAGCYVELQFTEHKKGFWDAPQGGAAKTTAERRGAQTGDPSTKSLETLVSDVKDLLAKKAPSDTKDKTEGAGTAGTLRTDEPVETGGGARGAAAETTLTDPVEAKAVGAASDEALDDLLPKPELDFSQVPSVASAKKHDPSLLHKPIAVVGGTTRKLTWAFLALILLGVGARYGHWSDFLSRPQAGEVKPPGQAESGANAQSMQSAAKDVATKSGEAEKAVATRNGVAPTAAVTGGAAEKSQAGTEKAGTENAEQPAGRTNEPAPEGGKASSAAADSARRGKSETSATVQAGVPKREGEPGGEGPLVPAKLLKSVNPVYPREAMQSFITGDVKAEVEVEPTGQVGEVKVISGPVPLRGAALDALKRYEFSAATRGGKAVKSKVLVTVKFWFNP